MGTTNASVFGAAARLPAFGREQRRGLWLVLLGPDGVGKSSVIASMGDGVAVGFAGCATYHLRANWLGRNKVTPPNCRPHAKRERGVVLSTCKLLYLLATNWLSYFMIVRPLVRRGVLVVFDRYFPDALVDAKRYRLPQSCGWLVELMEKYLPKPDLYAVLEAPAETLQQRKQEVPRAETERQCVEYRRLRDRLPNVMMVDASRALSQVADAVMECCIARHLECCREMLRTA